MKFVDVAEFYAEEGGGVRTYINQKLEAGARAGHEIVIVAPGPEDGEEERLGGRIVWVKGPTMPFDPRYFVLYSEKKVHQILDREAPDLVEGSSPWTGGWFAARWKGNAPRTFIFHSDPVAVYPQTFFSRAIGAQNVDRCFFWYWAYLRWLSRRFDATVVSGHWLARKLDGFGLSRPVAVPFGIDKDQFSPTRADPAVRARILESCGVGPDAALLVTISRFHPEKRLGTLFEAFRRASQEREMGLVVFGGGPLDGWVRKRAARVPGIRLAGYTKDREELAGILASADAMLHGSAAETYGLVVAEAICSGLPVIVPNVGGAGDLAGGGHAESYTPGDVRGCTSAILRMLDRDPAQLKAACAEIARDGIGTMADHFDGLFELYEGLVREGRG
jgi:alpha-1,6-mannosyltransferase